MNAKAKVRLPETDPSSGKRQEAVPRNLTRRIMAVLCGTMLMIMMMLTVVDVIGRYFFAHPIPGATELTEILLVAVIFLGLPLVSLDRDHVAVDIVTEHLPKRIRTILDLVTTVVSSAVLGVVAWRIWVYADQIGAYGGATNTLRLPLAPLGYLCAVSAAVGAVFMIWAAIGTLVKR